MIILSNKVSPLGSSGGWMGEGLPWPAGLSGQHMHARSVARWLWGASGSHGGSLRTCLGMSAPLVTTVCEAPAVTGGDEHPRAPIRYPRSARFSAQASLCGQLVSPPERVSAALLLFPRGPYMPFTSNRFFKSTRATHVHQLQPTALAFVSYGFVYVRVRVPISSEKEHHQVLPG